MIHIETVIGQCEGILAALGPVVNRITPPDVPPDVSESFTAVSEWDLHLQEDLDKGYETINSASQDNCN